VEEAAPYSEKTASQIDQAIRDLLAQAQAKALAILKQNREVLDQTAEKLLTKETLSADELPKRVSFVTIPGPAAAAGGKRTGG
jgi:ATP-dependent Zn protease